MPRTLHRDQPTTGWGVWCRRSQTSSLGPAESWMKDNGKIVRFDSAAEAEEAAKEVEKKTTTGNVYYSAAPFHPSQIKGDDLEEELEDDIKKSDEDSEK